MIDKLYTSQLPKQRYQQMKQVKSKLTAQDYLQLIELIKDNFETSEDNQVVEYWDGIKEKLYEEVNTLAYYSNHNL